MSTGDRRRPPAQARIGPRRRATPTQARFVAVRVLERVERAGAFADLALHAALRDDQLTPRDRAFVTDLVYGTLRWRGRLDHLLGFVLDRELTKLEPLVATLLRIGAYQVLFCDGVPASAAVDQTVRCARALGAARAGGFVNAVLRQLVRKADRLPLPALEDDPVGHLTHTLSLPTWVAERFLDVFGPEEAAALAAASNAVPPMVARANTGRTTRDALVEELRSRRPDVRACSHAPAALDLGHAGNPALDPAFLEGRMTIQDEASQLVVELLGPRPGERILDLCAAPGTKATAIAERVGPEGAVLAVDRHPRRLGLVRSAARRLGLANVTCLERDGTAPLEDLPGAPFDRILVDAPCSGLGTLRRHADARWRVQPDDPQRLAETQHRLLERARSVLRPGGRLVYSTCTVLPEENEAVVDGLLAAGSGLRRVPPGTAEDDLGELLRPFVDEVGDLRTLPHRHGMDGFFAARLVKDDEATRRDGGKERT